MRYLQAFDDDEDQHSLPRLRNMVSAILQVESGFQEWHLGQGYFVVFLIFDEVLFFYVATLKYTVIHDIQNEVPFSFGLKIAIGRKTWHLILKF